MSTPHIAIVAFYFPPSRASGVYRLLALANHLSANGWDVTVFTVTDDFFEHITRSSDDTLVGVVDPRVRVERVPIPMSHLEQDIRRFGRVRGNFPEAHRRIIGRLVRRVWLDQYGSWVPGLVRRMLAVHRERPFDVTLATGNPYSCYQGVWTLKQIVGVPYVLDSRDSWTLDLFSGERSFTPGHAAYTWEARTFSDAEAICFVNEPLRRWHQREYPSDADKMLVVGNGYDDHQVGSASRARPDDHEPDAAPEALTADSVAASCEAVAPREPPGLRFGYVGTLTGNQPHQSVWAGWKLAREDDDVARAGMNLYGHLGFFGVSSAVARMLPLGDRGLAVKWHGPVGKADVGAAYDALDVLVMIVADSPYVTSGKVFEYMSTGKLIVGLYEPTCAVADVLDDYPLVVRAASLHAGDIAQAFVAAARRAPRVTDAERSAARAYAVRFERVHQLAPLEARLRDIAGARSASTPPSNALSIGARILRAVQRSWTTRRGQPPGHRGCAGE